MRDLMGFTHPLVLLVSDAILVLPIRLLRGVNKKHEFNKFVCLKVIDDVEC